jgi:CheY-like chemotaxis protein
MGKLIRALAVDDDESVLRSLKDLLEELGISVTTVSNGRDAWAHLKSGKTVNLIVSDKDMSGMGGLELMMLVRGCPEMDSIAFLLISGDTCILGQEMAKIQEACMLPRTSFLFKPFRYSEFCSTIRSALSADE